MPSVMNVAMEQDGLILFYLPNNRKEFEINISKSCVFLLNVSFETLNYCHLANSFPREIPHHFSLQSY